MEQKRFDKVVSLLKHNDFRIISSEGFVAALSDNLSGLHVDLEYYADGDYWYSSIHHPSDNYGFRMGALDDGRWLLKGCDYPSVVSRAVRKEVYRMREDRRWSANWNFKYFKEHGI
jgi:hypothetical protein